MGKRHEQTFLQRRHTYGQQIMKRCSTLLIIREMQTKITLRYRVTSIRIVKIKNSRNNKYWQECGEKGTLVCCWWECKLVRPLWKTVWRVLKKTKNRTTLLSYNHTTVYLHKEYKKTLIQRDICTPVFITVLFTIAQTMEAAQVSIDRWMSKNVVYIHNTVLLSHKKEILPFATTWMDLENIMLSEISQSEKKNTTWSHS